MRFVYLFATISVVCLCATAAPSGQGNAVSEGHRLFESETFGGNGRTCRTCHSRTTGTVSPGDAQQLFKTHPDDPLFLADGSDDGNGNGTTRIQLHATILMSIPLPPTIKLVVNSVVTNATHVTVFRGIPTTLNTPGFEALAAENPVIMLDGRQPSLESQALGAIQDHAHGVVVPTGADLQHIKEFQLTNPFFSSPQVREFVFGGPDPGLPRGNTAAEKRGRRFFEDEVDFVDPKHGLCAGCHAGPMLNQTNLFTEIVFLIPLGTRFQNIGVSQINANGVQNANQRFEVTDSMGIKRIVESDRSRAVADYRRCPGRRRDLQQLGGLQDSAATRNPDTGPYFHDNSAKTLEDVMKHYVVFFGGLIDEADSADIIAFMKLLR